MCRSADLSDSDLNEQLEKSLKKITRLISVPENEKLEEENKFLLTRLSSVVEQLSLGASNGAAVALESGQYRDDDSSVSPILPFSYPAFTTVVYVAKHTLSVAIYTYSLDIT